MIKKNIKIANSSDIKFLFNLYNKGISGGFFKRKKEISYDQHKSWFSKALNSNNLKNYILFYKSNKIGYIRFQLINKRSVTVSIIIMKKYRKLGPTINEQSEDIELLRAIENDMRVYSIPIKGNSFSIDIQDDLLRARVAMKSDKYFGKY